MHVARLVLASFIMLFAVLLGPLHGAMNQSRNLARQSRLLLYGNPIAAQESICHPASFPSTLCTSDLAWHGLPGEATWTSLCGNTAGPSAQAMLPERYYRLIIRCQVKIGAFSLPLPLLEATVFR